MTERARWLLLVLSLVLALGGGLGVALFRIAEVQHEQDRDMCELIDAVLPAGAPPPATERGRQQAEAIGHYRQRRC